MLTDGALFGRYEIVAPLGAGGMGEVYRARDSRLGRQVALKFLHPHVIQDKRALDRFAREARAASALNHPNIVTIYDIGEAEAGQFIAMELVEGQTLRKLLAEARSLDALLDIGWQVAKALATAHAAGIVHRDIKPDNIMLREDRYVKVLDFGLARLVSDGGDPAFAITRTDQTGGRELLGTVAYMSPEQIRGEVVTTATDVFSLGSVLYELGTGEHPFSAPSYLGVASAILTQAPLPPSRLNPELPAWFEELLLAMLEKDARLRPTAASVEAGLSAHRGRRSSETQSITVAGAFRRALIGRDDAQTALAASLQSATTERGLMHAIVAEPGFGKTTFVEHFLQTIATAGPPLRIGRGRCSERLAGAEAYLPVLEALDSLLHGESGDAVARAMRLLAPAWFVQLQPVAAPEGSSQRTLSDAAGGSSEQMKRQLAALLQELTRSAPLILFFDDVHWADASTVDLIAYLCDRFDSLRLLLLVTYRPSDLLVAKHPFIEVKLHLQGRDACRETTLGPFSREDVDRYLTSVYPHHELPAQFVSALYERTEGAPLFVVDLLRQLVSRGILKNDGGVWRLTPSSGSLGSEWPESIRSVIQRTIDRLDNADRRLLVAASVQGVQFDSAVIARAIQMDAGEVEERLERLERVHGLVRLVDERELAGRLPSLRYTFVHIFYQNALQGTLRGSRRATLSATMAEVIQALHGESPGGASELAVLYETGRKFEQAATHFLTAARHALRVFAYKEAVVLAHRGLEAAKALADSPERARLELQLQITLAVPLTGLLGYAAPDVEQAYARARELCSTLGDTPSLMPVLHGLYRFYIVRGRVHAAHEIVQQLIALAERTGEPKQMLVALGALGAPLIHLGAFDLAIEKLTTSLTLYDPERHAGDRLVYGADPGVAALLWLALALWLRGRPDEALEANRRALELAERQRQPFGLAYAQSLTAWLNQYRGDPALVRHHAEASIQIAREHDFQQWLALGVMYRAWALVALGETEQGMAELTGGLDSFRRTGAELNLPHFLSLLADAHLRAGSPSVGLEAIDEALAIGNANDDRCWEPELHRLRGELLVKASLAGPTEALGGLRAATEAFRAAIAAAERQKSPLLQLRAALSLSGLLAASPQESRSARALVATALQHFPDRLSTTEIERARTLMREGGGPESASARPVGQNGIAPV
ncbi:MAG: protein kinase [Acidobacteria bacterium]|nr:protein kinase [Acidobacteriota bacterium]